MSRAGPAAWVRAALAAVLLMLWHDPATAQDAPNDAEAAVEEEDAPVAEVAAAGPPGVRQFLSRPVLSEVDLSPSGRYMAYVLSSADRARLYIRDLETGERTTVMDFGLTETRHTRLDSLSWKRDDRLVVSRQIRDCRRDTSRRPGPRGPAPEGQTPVVCDILRRGEIVAVDRDGQNTTILASTVWPLWSPNLLSLLPDDPDHVLVSAWTSHAERGTVTPANANHRPALLLAARVHVDSARAIIEHQTQDNVTNYYVDRAGDIIGRFRYLGRRGRRAVIERLEPETQAWRTVAELRASELRALPDFSVIGPTSEPGRLYVIRRPETPEEGDTAGVHIFDFATGQLGPPIWRHERYDVTGIVRDVETDALLAGCYWADVYRCDFEDPGLQGIFTGLSDFFDGERSLTIVSQSDDGGKWVLEVSGPDEPRSYYLYDHAARNIELVGNSYPGLPVDRLGLMQRVDYAARDGAALSGYFTALPGNAAPRPLVVMPHGGPEARDNFAFSVWGQFLASRGYAVFQPNFRGSSGFGRAFAEAGYRQWGRLMQDDVTDGVQALIDQGLADPYRICIMGGSYGGYVALWGGADQPDLYRCVISLAGVSDPLGMIRWERSTFGADSDRYQYWERALGHPRDDRAALEAIAPIRRVETWRPPVLLIHGDRDQIVPVEQSLNMERALRDAGKPATLLVLEGAGHSNWGYNSHSRALNAIEAFLAEHLPATP